MLKLSEIVNKFHLFLSGYIVVGWMFSDIHSKILLGLIPSVYGNWLVTDHKCLLTVLEHKLIEIEETTDDSNVDVDSKKDDDSNVCPDSNNDDSNKDDSKKDDEEEVYEGFILKMLKSHNIDINNDDLNKILTVISYHSFLQSYRNVILT
jgi:hypothetical protein